VTRTCGIQHIEIVKENPFINPAITGFGSKTT